MAESNKIAIIVHHNDEITVRDERGYPAVCRDCRFAGWRNQAGYDHYSAPTRCLHHSGGADPIDGDRILGSLDTGYPSDWRPEGKLGKKFPTCVDKNPDGKCEDFVPAKPLPWNLRTFWYKIRGQEWRWPQMRL